MIFYRSPLNYVATVFSVRKGSSTNHYWEQLTLVSVKWPWDETVHLKFHDSWPLGESSKWIFSSIRKKWFLLVHINPVVSDLGFSMIHLIQIAPKNFFIPLHKEVAIQFSASNHWTFRKTWFFSSLNSKMAWNNPKIEKCEQKKILAAILCYVAFDQYIGFSDDFLHVPYHPYLFFPHTSRRRVVFFADNSKPHGDHQPRNVPHPNWKNTGRLVSPWNPIGVQQRQQWINRRPQDCRPC